MLFVQFQFAYDKGQIITLLHSFVDSYFGQHSLADSSGLDDKGQMISLML